MTVAVVVGAGPGLGRAIARRFGAAGFEIALVGRTPQTLEAVAAELIGNVLGRSVESLRTDAAAL